MRKTFNRRVLLRGLGGAVVAAPFLSSVAERTAKAQGLPPPPAPKRLIVFFTHYGCLTNRWFPAKSHGPLSKSRLHGDVDARAHGAVRGQAADGPRHPRHERVELRRGPRADERSPHAGLWNVLHLPPRDPQRHESSASNVGKFDAKPTGRTLDHVCAEQVNPGGVPPLFIQIGGVSGSASNTQSVISYDQPERDLSRATGRRWRSSATSRACSARAPMSPDSYPAARGKSVIDCVREDLDNLMRVDMSRSDKKKLADWTELLNQTGDDRHRPSATPTTATRLGLTQESVQAATAAPPRRPVEDLARHDGSRGARRRSATPTA